MTDQAGLSGLRFPAMLLAIGALLLALWFGFVRLGWTVQRPGPIVAHGGLMVSGFLGTLIGVERAVALRRRVAYLPPLLTGIGAAADLSGAPPVVGSGLIVLGSAGLVVMFGVILSRHRALHTIVMTLGAVSWLVGNVLWLAGWSIPRLVWWWAGFLLLTIAGERLELSRIRRLSNGVQRLFVLAAGVIGAGLLVTTLFASGIGTRMVGAGLALLAIWLLRFDVATRTVRRQGLTRFIAVCLLAGYGWLLVGGVLALVYGYQVAGFHYDAMLHAVFLGFVMSIIFGHAPIIFPSVLGMKMRYSPLFYGHLVLLQASLVARVMSDLLAWLPGRKWGGLLNIVAVLLFLMLTVWSAFNHAERQAV